MTDTLNAMHRAILRHEARESTEPRAHKQPCSHCPSAHFPIDPESAEVATWPHAMRVETTFPCGWAPKRYCKGYCDQMGVTDDDLAAREARK